MGNLSHLDTQSLQAFVDNDIKDFLTKTEEIRRDKDSGDTKYPVRALKSLVDGQATPQTIGQNQILALGPMVNDDTTHGKGLIEALKKAAGSIDEILERQVRIFQDIDRDFRQTLKHMTSAQEDNLTKIEAAKLLELLEDVDNDMGPTKQDTTTKI
ncbi:type VII secretion system-associated protein [Streptomyces violaceorubidus]|uniref:type VII secretion system-associated protein n=1 Tax=Streptomyces violaceorubidus TaxID=284042 RepID=UPI0004C0ACD6|nr:type VII secretion system-associated protein [Streptomyces violaceorubidus]